MNVLKKRKIQIEFHAMSSNSLPNKIFSLWNVQRRSTIVYKTLKTFSKQYAAKIGIKQAKQQPHLRFPDLTG